MNAVIHELWEESVEEWEVERALAKSEKRKIGWKKPVLKGELLPAIPKPPKLVLVGEEPEEVGPSSSESDTTNKD